MNRSIPIRFRLRDRSIGRRAASHAERRADRLLGTLGAVKNSNAHRRRLRCGSSRPRRIRNPRTAPQPRTDAPMTIQHDPHCDSMKGGGLPGSVRPLERDQPSRPRLGHTAGSAGSPPFLRRPRPISAQQPARSSQGGRPIRVQSLAASSQRVVASSSQGTAARAHFQAAHS